MFWYFPVWLRDQLFLCGLFSSAGVLGFSFVQFERWLLIFVENQYLRRKNKSVSLSNEYLAAAFISSSSVRAVSDRQYFAVIFFFTIRSSYIFFLNIIWYFFFIMRSYGLLKGIHKKLLWKWKNKFLTSIWTNVSSIAASSKVCFF